MNLIFYGDPHGRWMPLTDAVIEGKPDAVVIVGDCDLDEPLHAKLAKIFDAGVQVLFIHGNHEKDSADRWDNLVGDHPEGFLHGRVLTVGTLRIAGLGGVFKQRVWLPPAAPLFMSRAALLRSLSHQQRWRRGVPLRQRDAIFPEDVTALQGLRADILVTHEAPSTHSLGFAVIDDLARAIQVKLIVHGHHHSSRRGVTADGIRVIGLAKAEVFRIHAGDLT
jgi:predicted phosphodiesterase